MRNYFFAITICAALLLFFQSAPLFPSSDELPHSLSVNKVTELLKKRISSAGRPSKIIVRGEKLHASSMIADFYRGKGFEPVWVQDKNYQVLASELISAINNAYLEGLAPAHYHLEQINLALDQAVGGVTGASFSGIETLADLEMLLTDAYLMLSCHYSEGCESSLSMEPEWLKNVGNADLMSLLQKSSRERRIKEALNELLPSSEEYSRLRDALARHRLIEKEGGWPKVSNGPLLRSGSQGIRVAELKKRLSISGDLNTAMGLNGAVFNNELKDAVIRFQKRHGLRVDGIVGPGTLNALNIPASSRIRQIELNLARLRWIRVESIKRYIMVNIAGFSLDVIENGGIVMSMKAIVGKPYWNTPVLNEKMTHIVLNPSWNIPESIAAEEILPKLRVNRDYLKKQNINIFKRGSDNDKISPDSIDWPEASEDNFNYLLKQEPGPLNPLGQIKFVFPNSFNVYIHDTPYKSAFNSEMRNLSHGCIRIEHAEKLAEYLLKGDTGWPLEKIKEVLSIGKEKTVLLKEPIDVIVIYMTSWVDKEGEVQFRNDIYGRDSRLDNYLRAK
ncbi:MAG: L,D-transpeptidase family protein [Nitrospirae bacterium]|nr:L,D-transpeptidase family protein [Nitrospirota bacterium]